MAPLGPFASKLKVYLKLSISRLRIVQQKDTALAKQQRRDMANLLEQGKYESARIRVENIIRSDLTTELLEIIELYCELLLARIGLMEPHTVDPGLEEAIVSIIFAASRTEIKELQQCRQLLAEKYGKDFTLNAMDNRGGKVPERVLKKMRVEPPSPQLVESYLKAIANAYGVQYADEEAEGGHSAATDQDDQDYNDNDETSSGGRQAEKNPLLQPLHAQELSYMSPPKDLGPRSPVSIAPPSPKTDNPNPMLKLPGPPVLQPSAKMKIFCTDVGKSSSSASTGASAKAKVDGSVPYVDDLENRFAMLKR